MEATDRELSYDSLMELDHQYKTGLKFRC